jgi:hypothetical protein
MCNNPRWTHRPGKQTIPTGMVDKPDQLTHVVATATTQLSSPLTLLPWQQPARWLVALATAVRLC